jgi:hypothetical protein
VGELVTVRQAGRHERTVRAGLVSCEAPLVYPVDSAPGQRLFGLRLAVDLTPRSPRAQFVAVLLRVSLDDRGAVAAAMEADGVRPVSVDGLREHRFGWFFGGFDRRADLGTRYVVTAVIQAPEELAAVTGTVRVDASILRGRLRPRLDHATMRDPVALAVRPAGILPAPAVRLCVAADIERFSRFRAPEAAVVQQRFADVMAQARARAGIDGSQVGLQRSGDGQAAVFPPAIDESRAIPLLVQGLADALAQANAGRAAQDRIRLRVALDRGHTTWAANGWVGDPPVTVQRLLDSAPARQALADNPGTDFALIVSDVVYRDVIAHDYGNLSSRAFRLVHVDIPAKNFTELAWVYVPLAGGEAPRTVR